ncbi:NAD(P)-binding domain-containing protein [SAR92 clade bacterium H921]|nr:NAD(P)-binding domain-containing protein [SAR92 clade bacterium H921]
MKQVNDVVVIGAGPVGLAAAAHLLAQGLKPLVLEKGVSVGSAMLEWGHVRVFTPWSYVIDEAVAAILEKNGWNRPDNDYLPIGREIVEQYLVPAAHTPELASAITYNAEVIAVSKENHSKHTSADRQDARYTVHYKDSSGSTHIVYADAVIDVSGTWATPNPIGLDGLPVPGETENQDAIAYGLPDTLNADRQHYEGKKTLVIGAGHSAMNIALNLLKLQARNAETKIVWGLRNNDIEKLLGGGINDKVPARRELGLAAKQAIDTGALELLAQFKVERIVKNDNGLEVQIVNEGQRSTIYVDRIIVATGFRPNLQMLREVRLDIDHVAEAPSNLAPLIDPNLHFCGSVRAHGVEELSHFDEHFFIAGMKSYGRAPTFLMLTGYEQVRSIAAELAGEHDAARHTAIKFPGKTLNKSACCG